ncbi:MAG TPA: TIGR03067 domain-containing protein, partial [Gemmataceae bacterium]
GSVLYAMCTGRPPFGESSALAVLRRVTDEEPRPISHINQEIPDWLIAIIAKLHAKAPANRYQSASEVADVLAQRLAEVQQAGWTPPPARPTERFAEPPPQTVKPLTSVTICPLCACHLHVPDRMVGQVVNCPECGKPFHVEDGTEEIEVLRGLQVQKPRPAAKRKTHGAMVVAIVLFAVLALLLVTCGVPLALMGTYVFQSESGPDVSHAASSVPAVMEGKRAKHGPLGPDAEDLARVECVWQATQIVQEGENADEAVLAQTTWEFGDGDFTLRLKTGIQRGHYMLDTGVDPKWIDLDVTGGEYLGIYKWEEDKLIVCLAPMAIVGGEVRSRPQEFSAPPGSGRTMYVLRQKKN